ncbi:hypothetical protein TNCV_173121 [Trichonephila clavipes]|nr:hypothetical protein TNCV_173121 [Trichonephila clavipes]
MGGTGPPRFPNVTKTIAHHWRKTESLVIQACITLEGISLSQRTCKRVPKRTEKECLPWKKRTNDEAHFWLNGYVNKQNCRIWSEANPQVYVETPLHPEKLTVWCALWAGGILLQKR